MRALGHISQENANTLASLPPVRKSAAVGIGIVASLPMTIQRKPGCACGGGCGRCQGGHASAPAQSALRVNTPGDGYEQEADRIADQVMRIAGPALPAPVSSGMAGSASIQRACSACGGARDEEELQAREEPGKVPLVTPEIHRQIDVLRGGGDPLPARERAFFEPRLGYDLGTVRIHTGTAAAESARSVQAQAYTLGRDVVFGEGNYAPESESGRRLLAHELVHTIQQGAVGLAAGGAAAPSPAPQRTSVTGIQRTPTISIVDENFVGPLSQSQRRAAKSCPINCCDHRLGTLHAMPLFYSQSRTAIVPAGSASATGIGAALHFIAESSQPPAGDICHCDNFRMIQVITSNYPADPRGNNSFVDNGNTNTPFYGDVGRSGRGEHAITGRYPDSGERVSTTESIYDTPYRRLSDLGTTSLSWMAETCVACVKNNGPDRLLGCLTYGFTRNYNNTTSSYDPVAEVSPACRSYASTNFVSTLRSDPTTITYDFQVSPDLVECPVGDFPSPPRDRRYA